MEYWIWLSMLPYIGPITVNRLLEHFGHPLGVYHADITEFRYIKGMTQRQVQSITENRSLDRARRIMEECDRNHIFILAKSDIRYPDRAKWLEDAPAVLYYKGNLVEVKEPVAIVGARRCTQEEKQQAVILAQQCVEKKQAVISGMAKGIDSYAHTACLKAEGYTVAILGNGLDICYPSEHNKLMECIEQNGLLLSEYPPGTRPTQYTFPRRNRLISAWAERIIVIAPGKGSGALITAEYGRKYGRAVEIVKCWG